MLEKIKGFISGIGYVFRYGGTIRNVTTAWSNYPGLDDSESLRHWLRPLLVDVASLTLLTKTTIDDVTVQAAIKILDSNSAWNVVYSLILAAQEGIGFSPLIPEGTDVFEQSRSVAQETMPSCPTAVISAIGLILFLLRKKKEANR